MKIIPLLILIMMLCIGLTSMKMPILLQEDAGAKRILDRSSRYYKSLKSMKAHFKVDISNPDAGIAEQELGDVYIKGNDYKITTPDYERIANKEGVFTHFIAVGEVQITELSAEEGEITPAELFNVYSQDFIYQLEPSIEEGKVRFDVIALTPKDKERPYFKIRLYIDQQSKLVKRGMIFEKNGTTLTYSLDNYKENVDLSDDFFILDESKYPDLDVIDLRY